MALTLRNKRAKAIHALLEERVKLLAARQVGLMTPAKTAQRLVKNTAKLLPLRAAFETDYGPEAYSALTQRYGGACNLPNWEVA